MEKRCILIFPTFENMNIIDTIRAQYDPNSKFVNPHITLVFPFESELETSKLSEHIRNVLKDFRPFYLKMKGMKVSIEPEGNYLFLNLVQGLQEIYGLSKALYTGILEKYQSDIYKNRYLPHMTIGKLKKTENYDEIIDRIGNQETEFLSYINFVCALNIFEDNSSIIEITNELIFPLIE